ncbi:dual OB domain-containing protein [Aphanothece sacrum]|uniref:WD40 repeat-containing protein n=1 Tax=Aphanothece sacrum FPU1 TaxID=1920663 RepID=A0A401IFC0_APHSA|nr:hypothetical protein [Aphanothece sacrum]GBF79870.1 WD40 repeat-containing protein [Aphanothece sacrum FPU1]GBF83910.1 WD repeat-containing protein [Aphanothece sacrum FPU3]
MAKLTQLICLANSWKKGERCLAGVDVTTHQWIRPICKDYPEDGRVPATIRLINEQEPALLDIIEIPLENEGNDFGFEAENYWIGEGKWRKVGQAKVSDIVCCCGYYWNILHNNNKYVTVPFLQHLPKAERRTLQLVYTRDFQVIGIPRSTGITNWKGSVITVNGQILENVSITDPKLTERLDQGENIQGACLVTISLSMPRIPPGWEGGDPCWKLIAGVIELTENDQILAEMQRLQWTIDQGREYLINKYNKRSRSQLTSTELTEFLTYLQSL